MRAAADCPRSRSRTIRFAVVGTLMAAGFSALAPTPKELVEESTANAGGVAPYDWLGTVNAYRAMSGLAPVGINNAWNAGTRNHGCYMLTNGIAHDEVPGKPGYTSSGDAAGNASNVALAGGNPSPQDFIEMWLTAPYHAIGLLRPGFRQTSYGECRKKNKYSVTAAAAIDVIRGTDFKVKNSSPILFPGNNATIRLTSFIAEWPDPLEACGWSRPAGLPLIALMPRGVSWASSSLASPDGSNPTCTISAGNAGHPVAKSVLDGSNAVVIVPRRKLADGRHTVRLRTGAGNVNWSFTVKQGGDIAPAPSGSNKPQPKPQPKPAPKPAPKVPTVKLKNAKPVAKDTHYEAIAPQRVIDTRIPRGTTRLRAGQVRRVKVAPSNVDAVTANFTVVDSAAVGHLTAYDCSGGKPNSSTLNFTKGRAVANVSHVGLDKGQLCLVASTDVHAIVDVNGYYRESGKSPGYQPITPRRILDTRSNAANRLQPNRPIQLTIPGNLIANGSRAASINLTVVNPAAFGHITAYPCNGSPATSNLNYLKNETIANAAVVPLTNRTFCIVASASTDLVVDVSGYFSSRSQMEFTAITPIRVFDSRSTQRGLNGVTKGGRVGRSVKLQIAGVRGIPRNARVVNLNLTGVEPVQETYVTAYSCDKGDSGTSNVNLRPDRYAAAGNAMVELSSSGKVCIRTNVPSHLVIDVTGYWTR